MALELCNEVALASGQPLKAKQPSVHLWPTRETRLPQDLLISGSVLSTVSSPAILLRFLQRILSLISSALGRALSMGPLAPERTVGVPKPWTSDVPFLFIIGPLFWPRPSFLLSFSIALPSLSTQNLGPLEITAQLTQKQKSLGSGVILPG